MGRTKHNCILVVVVLFAAFSVAGCVPSRQRYYGRVHGRRTRSFQRWEDKERREDLGKPALEGPLDLEEAVRLTLACNTGIQAVLQEKERARGRIVSAYSEALPRVDLSASYDRLDKVRSVDLGVETFQIGDRDNYSARVDITQPLFKGGSILIAQRAARIFRYLSDETIRQSVEDALFNTATAYFDARLAEHLIEVQRAALESATRHLNNVRSRRRHGTATEYDVLRARVDLSNIRADLIEQQNARDQAVTGLMRAMGVSQRSNVELTTDMEYVRVEPDFVASVKRAFANRPDIYQAELNVDLQGESLKEAYSRYWPRMEAYFWNLWSKPDPHESSRIAWGEQWQAGLRLNWPLFDGLAREGRIVQEEALLRQKEILLSDAEERAVQEVQNTILELQNARELVESQRLNLRRADRALKLVQSGYKEGVNTEVEVLDARGALTRARGLYFQALHRHTVARVQLRKVEGILGPVPGKTEEPEEMVDPERVLTTIDRPANEVEGAER